MGKSFRAILVVALCVGAIACQQETDVKSAGQVALQFGTPLDARLKDTYMRTCRNCHKNDVPGIPRAGDREDWQPRVAQGLDVLVQRAMNGYKGMPAMGLCTECEEPDIRAIIAYMAGMELDAAGQ